jgi:DNA-binding HxlR family transcriptional regulator
LPEIKGFMRVKNNVKEEFKCTLNDILNILGGKWSIPVIHNLFPGKKRFTELERSIPNINTRMLVKELKNLEKFGIVKREAFPTVPITVEYSLTEKGRALEPIIVKMLEWGDKYIRH